MRPTLRGPVLLAAALLVLSACSNQPAAEGASDRLTPPRLGACRDLSAADLEKGTNDDAIVACSEQHTAQTFATGALPATTGKAYGAREHGEFVFRTCNPRFQRFLGADESLAMRVQLSWAWFGPSKKAWQKGARWYRCDAVGGDAEARELRRLPTTTKGLFSRGESDTWLTCAVGPTVSGSKKVPCSEKHDWRAVTAVKVGQPTDPYPGDKIVRARSRDRCSDWVGAWLNYTPDYDYGYSWFHQAEWEAGNRRSVCWAKTDR
jgi:hypothetical protein